MDGLILAIGLGKFNSVCRRLPRDGKELRDPADSHFS
jgi:hypothetical protein